MYEELIKATLKTIINQFHRKPFNFFNEHEFHQYCHYVFNRKKPFSKQFTTLDGKKTNILHPEYPTVQKYKRDTVEMHPRGTRARYDIAILNPEFIENNKINTVINRDINLISGKKGDLIAAIEFKFITKHDKNFQHEIDWDLFKLQNAREADLKYQLIFANTIEAEIDYFKSLPKTDVKVVYVVVWEEGGKKLMKVRQWPEEWLYESHFKQKRI